MRVRGGKLNRRDTVIALLALGAAAGSVGARAQQKALPVIGFLNEAGPAESSHLVSAFRHGLRDTGHVEGRNVVLEYRWAEGRYERLAELAADLVRRKVSVIATGGGPRSALAAKAATTIIPIVFTIGVDPTRIGLVARLNRPEGNATGVTMFTTVLTAKRLELLRELVPGLKVIAFLVNPDNPNAEPQVREVEGAARAMGQQLLVVKAGAQGDIDTAFSDAVQHHAGALIVSADPFLTSQRARLVALAARRAIPTIYQWREFTEAGGLISYGSSLDDAYRQAGAYAGQILNGARPGELPVLQPAKFDLVVNLKTARALGLTVPQTILLRADRVIE